MLYCAVVFFVIAIVASLLGFGDVAVGASGLAEAVFALFAAQSVAGFVLGLFRDWRQQGREVPAESPVRQPT